jgi:hypothetical protein
MLCVLYVFLTPKRLTIGLIVKRFGVKRTFPKRISNKLKMRHKADNSVNTLLWVKNKYFGHFDTPLSIKAHAMCFGWAFLLFNAIFGDLTRCRLFGFVI